MLHTKLLFQYGFNPFTANPTYTCYVVSVISYYYCITIVSLLFMPTNTHTHTV